MTFGQDRVRDIRVWCCLLWAIAACGQELHTPARYVVPLMPAAPVVDGRVQPGEWRCSVRLPYFSWKGRLVRRRADAWIGATRTHLYLAVVSRLPDEGELTTKVALDTSKIVYDDSIEAWIDPTPGSRNGAVYQILTNAAGRCGYVLHVRGNVPENPAWRGNWRVRHAVDRKRGEWQCEIAVPIAEIAPGRTALDGVFGINLCRNWKQPWQFSSLQGGAYAPKETVFRFVADGAPAVAMDVDGDPFTGNFTVSMTLRNPSHTALSLIPAMVLDRDQMPSLRAGGGTIELAPEARREIRLTCRDASTRKFRLRTAVRRAGTSDLLFSREMVWNRGASDWKWIARTPPPPAPIDVRFAFYPYRKALRFAIDLEALPDNVRLEALNVSVRRVPAGEKRAEDAPPLLRLHLTGIQRDREIERVIAFDPPPGVYELVIEPEGPRLPASVRGAVVRRFERKRFPWEHNPDGRTERAWPPFRPIQVDGRRVRVVLREHLVNDLGLWDQVTAESAHTHVRRPVLAGPMTLRAVVNGQETTVRPRRALRLERTSERAAAGAAEWQAGPVAGMSRISWDCDGMMQVELEARAAKGAGAPVLDRLELVVPFRSAAATHIHAMADGIRNTISKRLPDRQGVLWDSRRVAVNEFPRNFCTYIFVGTPVRGICWFTETPAGWAWDSKTPNVVVRRQGDTTFLIVHFVNRPRRLTAPVRITFGLQAAPVKPRLSPWRHRWFRDKYTLLGTDINWFALGNCGSVYPAGKDLFLWRMIRRGNREHLTDQDIRRTIERGRKWFEPYGSDYVNRFEKHVRYNLRARYGKRMVFYYNRASYQAAEEFQTFQDEWSLSDFRTVGPGNGVNEIKIVPSESYIDHALYWYGKSFDEAGNQGVYWDNWFFVATYNTFMTPAARQPDGTVLPATGLSGLRELARRTFCFMNERGMLPITMAHMTSTAILPMLSYCTVQYDWEWKYSQGDFQDRFSREYVLLVSNGELAGTWPVLLHDHGPLADDDWTNRTCAAVCIVHELDPPISPWNKCWKTVWQPLLQPIHRMLNDAALEVWRYWDERPQPVRTNDPDVPVIVYALPGREAVAAMGSWAEDSRTLRVTVDAQALGFPAGGWKAVDVETGREEVRSADAHALTVTIKSHDIREFRILPAPAP